MNHPFETEYRQCSLCKRDDVRWRYHGTPSGYALLKYSTRRYAHRACLIRRFGVERAKGMIPEHEWSAALPDSKTNAPEAVRDAALAPDPEES